MTHWQRHAWAFRFSGRSPEIKAFPPARRIGDPASGGKKISANAIASLRYIKQRFDPLVYH